MTDISIRSPSARSHQNAAGTYHRGAYKLMTGANSKTPKGEALGYLTATLYLSPHTIGGGATLCPHSTEDCRAMCLAGAGLSGLPLQLAAKQRRTQMFNERRAEFLTLLRDDLHKLKRISNDEMLKPAARLNGTSDVIWERVWPIAFADFWQIQFYEYTKIPLEFRTLLPKNLHLTYSYMGPQDAERAVRYLRAAHSVAVVVPEDRKAIALQMRTFRIGASVHPFVDGDEHDLRFLDPPGSIVLLKPKGHVRTGLMRPDFMHELGSAPEIDERLERRKQLGHQ